MAKTLREQSETPRKGWGMVESEKVTPVKKRDQKAIDKGYAKKDKKSMMDNILGKNKKSTSKPSLFDSNPFNKKPSRLQKTLIATPGKFEIKVTKSKSPAAFSPKKTRKSGPIGIRGKLAALKPKEVKKPQDKKISKKSKPI